jgi:hypothetical protein
MDTADCYAFRASGSSLGGPTSPGRADIRNLDDLADFGHREPDFASPTGPERIKVEDCWA